MQYKLTKFDAQIAPDKAFDDRHHSMYCCVGYFNAFVPERPAYRVEINGTSVYYTVGAKRINVLGTLCQYTDEEIDLFCTFLFQQYPHKYINWGGFYHPYESGKYIAHKTAIVSDIIMDLPADEKSYLQSLNSTTRKHVQYYKRRFLRDFPEGELKVYRNEEISHELIEQIIHFNHLRMEEKNTHSDLDETDIEGFYHLCRECGIIHTVELNGRLIAATINPQINHHGHLAVISHDPEYNKYNTGQIALYETIADCIKEGGERFHFLWDMSDYKKRFGGQLTELYYYHIYPKNTIASLADKAKCDVTCSLMYFQKRSETGRKVIDRVKKVIGMK